MQLNRLSGSFSEQCFGFVRFLTGRQVSWLYLLAILVTGQGCFSYAVTELPGIRLQEQIRVELEDRGYRRIAPGANPNDRPRLEGRLARVDSDSLTVSIWIGEPYLGTPFQSAYQDIVVPLEHVRLVETRRLSRKRTALTAAGAVAIIAFLIDSIGFVDILGDGRVGEVPPDPPTRGGG